MNVVGAVGTARRAVASVAVIALVLGGCAAAPQGAPGPPTSAISASPDASRTTATAPSTSPRATSSPTASAHPFNLIAGAAGPADLAAVGAGSVWVAHRDLGTVTRVDASSGDVLATIRVGAQPHAIGVHGDQVWVSSTDNGGVVQRIDPATNTISERIEVGVEGYAMAFVGDTMWLTAFLEDQVVRVDLDSGSVVARITVRQPTGLVAAEDGVWVPVHFSNFLARIDPESNQAHLSTLSPFVVTEFVAMTDDEIWVTNGVSREVSIVSRDSNRLVDSLSTGESMGLVVVGDEVWIANRKVPTGPGADSLLVVDADSHEVLRELLAPGFGPYWPVSDGESVWVTASRGLLQTPVEP